MLYMIMAGLSVVAVSLWWLELNPFLTRMEWALSGPKLLAPIRTVAALPLLIPLIFDVAVTITFIAWFGGGGIVSLVISMCMSITLSVLMNIRLIRNRRLRNINTNISTNTNMEAAA